MKSLFTLALFCLAESVFGQDWLPVPDANGAQVTELGRYQVGYAPSLNPVHINQMHQWVVRITDADGGIVADANIEISGGMPAHDHGLPTAPQATTYLGDGRYLIEGMKFHMNGLWEVVLRIRAGQGMDSLTLSLTL